MAGYRVRLACGQTRTVYLNHRRGDLLRCQAHRVKERVVSIVKK